MPMHPALATGTLASILRQAGLTPEEFLGHLHPRQRREKRPQTPPKAKGGPATPALRRRPR
ncbi:MAG: hypothetical protein WCB85_15050 [Candidatus Dormiibacterota bacterium]